MGKEGDGKEFSTLFCIWPKVSPMRCNLVVILFLVVVLWAIKRGLPPLHLFQFSFDSSSVKVISCNLLSLLLVNSSHSHNSAIKDIILQHVFFTLPLGGILCSGVHDICTAIHRASLICMATTKTMEPHLWECSPLRTFSPRTSVQVPHAYVLFSLPWLLRLTVERLCPNRQQIVGMWSSSQNTRRWILRWKSHTRWVRIYTAIWALFPYPIDTLLCAKPTWCEKTPNR